METLNLSNAYADRDFYDECMRAGSLKTSLPARLYMYMYYISTTLFIIMFWFNPLYAGNPNLCVGVQRRLWRICALAQVRLRLPCLSYWWISKILKIFGKCNTFKNVCKKIYCKQKFNCLVFFSSRVDQFVTTYTSLY